MICFQLLTKYRLRADSVLPCPIFIRSTLDQSFAMSVTTRWPTAYIDATILEHGQTSKTISAALRRGKGVWRCNAQIAGETWNLAISAADENWLGSNVHQRSRTWSSVSEPPDRDSCRKGTEHHRGQVNKTNHGVSLLRIS